MRERMQHLATLVSLSILQLVLSPAHAQRSTAGDPLRAVNVFTGTSNSRWMLFPGATTPMGMVKFSPDNQGNVWDGGYEYTVGSISGFSFLHTLGLNSFSIMPLRGNIENEPGQPKLFPGSSDGPFGNMWTAGYRSRIDKKTEAGHPGYYAVTLLDADTRVELTATDRTGWMRFTPSTKGPTHLILDFGLSAEEAGTLESLHVQRRSATEVTGSITQSNHYAGEFTVYFDMQFSHPVGAMNSFENGAYHGSETNYGTEWRRPRTLHANVQEFDSKDSGGIWLDLNQGTASPMVIRTCIRLVSEVEAQHILAIEAAPFGFRFDYVSAASASTWSRVLGRIEVQGGSADDRTKLYTNLYRAYTGKAVLDDADGAYRDACGAVQHLPSGPGHHVYSSDALWGAQWDLGPLWALLDPALINSFSAALVMQAERGGWLPSGTPNMRYAPIMDAHHEIALLTGAWQKGERGFDGEAAYQAMRKVLTQPSTPYTCNGTYPGGIAGDRHMDAYLKRGFVPEEDGPASSTFEYAYDDACAATMAASLGHTTDAILFRKRAANWRNSMSPETHYAQRRRADGTFLEPNDIHHFGTVGGWAGPGFLEGTPWIYSWFVPQDVPGLIAFVGRNTFNERLEEGFSKGYVDLTNEPNLQAPWLFNYSGRPDLTQKHARAVFSDVFDTSALTGWPGEEDEGQMGAYVVLAGVGLFDMEGGCAAEPRYQISGPAFSQVTMHLERGDLRIVARDNSPENVYIKSATWNGRHLSQFSIRHEDVARGGTLVLEMSSRPAATIVGVAHPVLKNF